MGHRGAAVVLVAGGGRGGLRTGVAGVADRSLERAPKRVRAGGRSACQNLHQRFGAYRRLIAMLHDLRYALRTMRANPLFTGDGDAFPGARASAPTPPSTASWTRS